MQWAYVIAERATTLPVGCTRATVRRGLAILTVDVVVAEKPLRLDNGLQRFEPALVVVPAATRTVRGILPGPNRCDKFGLEVHPRIVAELGKRNGQPEGAALPFVIKRGLVRIGYTRGMKSDLASTVVLELRCII